jgi:poly(hydroxyalkanoate) granule-associated protein
MPTQDEKSLPGQAKDAMVDVRNELIVQSANLYLVVRKALLASIGSVALTADEVGDLFTRLVERGEIAEADAQKIMNDLRTQGRQREEEASKAREDITKKAGIALEDSVETILNRLNVPNKNEIEELSRKIGLLSEKVSRLDGPGGLQS